MSQREYLRAPEHIQEWSSDNSEVVQTLDTLRKENISAALYSGTMAAIGMRHLVAWRLPVSPMLTCFGQFNRIPLGHHSPIDTDVLVHDDDFWKAAEVLGADVTHESRKVDTADGYQIDYNLYVARKNIGARVLEICHPDGPMSLRSGDIAEEYDWHVSDLAVKNFYKFKTRAGIVTISHPSETEIIYSILQRDDKDVDKAAFSWEAIPYVHSSRIYYHCERLNEMKINTDRFLPFACKVAARFYEIMLEREEKSVFGNVKRFVRKHDGRIHDFYGVAYKLRIDVDERKAYLEVEKSAASPNN